MKLRRREEGYTLITVLLIFTVVTIIAVTLMAASVSTFKFVKSSENKTKDKLNAEMVLDEATALIQNELDGINSTLSTGSILPNQLLTMMQNSLNRVAQEKKNQCTITYDTLKDGSDADGVVLEKVTITVPVGDSGKVLKKVITLSTVSNALQYTAVTPSNLYLYGAPYIDGDVNVGGDLFTSNYGTYILGQTNYVRTSYPAINGSLTVKGKYYYSDRAPYIWKNFNTTNMQNYFSVVPKIADRNLSVDTIDVGGIIDKKKLSWPNNIPPQIPILGDKVIYGNQSDSTSKYFSSLTLQTNSSYTVNGNLYINNLLNFGGNLTIGKNSSLVVNGDLYIDNDLVSVGNLKVNGNIYVSGNADISGNLTITGNNHYIYIDNSTKTLLGISLDPIQSDVTLHDLTLDGVMYINRKAYLRDDVNTNGSIYVRNSIDVQNLSNNDGTLVLLCDGDIQLANNNEFNDNPKVIDAFFYSNEELFIYGIGSNLKINGGIYGNPIKLSASKGTTYENWNSLTFQKQQETIDPTKSRLSIYFKPDLILNLPKGVPTVNKVTLKEIDTSFDDK